MCTSIPAYRYRIQVVAQGSHSYQDFGRDNAIHIASQLIDDLYQIDPPKESVTTYNVGKINGGTTVNAIAQETVILYEYRSSSEKYLQKMKERFDAVIEQFRMRGKKISKN